MLTLHAMMVRFIQGAVVPSVDMCDIQVYLYTLAGTMTLT